MKKNLRFLALIAVSMAILSMIATGCDSEDDHSHRKADSASHLCATGISTFPLGKIFSSPHAQTAQHYSRQDSLSSLKRGRKHGKCSVVFTLKDRSRNDIRTTVTVEATVSNEESAEQLVSGSQAFDLIEAESVRSGKVVGISGPAGAAVAFPCTDRTDQAKSVKVTITFTPEFLNIGDERKKTISDTLGTFAIKTARHLNLEFLRCLDTADISGPISIGELKGHPQ